MPARPTRRIAHHACMTDSPSCPPRPVRAVGPVHRLAPTPRCPGSHITPNTRLRGSPGHSGRQDARPPGSPSTPTDRLGQWPRMTGPRHAGVNRPDVMPARPTRRIARNPGCAGHPGHHRCPPYMNVRSPRLQESRGVPGCATPPHPGITRPAGLSNHRHVAFADCPTARLDDHPEYRLAVHKYDPFGKYRKGWTGNIA